MRIIYLSLAVRDLAEVRTFIATHNPDAAARVGSAIRESISSLARFPNLGKPGRIYGTRELITPRIGKTVYIVVYRVQQEEIQILRVLPGMRDIDAVLETDSEDGET